VLSNRRAPRGTAPCTTSVGDCWDGLDRLFAWKERIGLFVTSLACNLEEETKDKKAASTYCVCACPALQT